MTGRKQPWKAVQAGAGGPGALRRLLDTSAGDLRATTLAMLLAALGVVLVFVGRLEGLLAFVPIIWANPERWTRLAAAGLERWPALVIGLPLTVVAITLVATRPFPVDDLLRHVARSAWPNGYADMYVHTSVPPVDLYPAFDRAAGALSAALGPMGAVWVIQGLCWTLFTIVFVKVALRSIGDRADAWYWVAGALLLTLSGLGFRLTLARPEMFLSIWAMSALLVRSRAGTGAWVLGGLLVGTGYWLSPIYFTFAAALPGSWRRRSVLFAGMCVAWLALWLAITGDLRLEGYRWAADVLRARHPEMTVTENASIVSALGFPWVLALLAGAGWAWRRPGTDVRLLGLVAFFALSNQIRYLSPIAPLLAFYILGALGRAAPVMVARPRVAALAALVFAAPAVASSLPRLAQLPRFQLPGGAVVFTEFGPATYATLFFNAGRVRVTPGFEVGAADPRVQQLVVDMRRGNTDCAALRSLGFTHFVDDSLEGTPQPCLELVEVQQNWRLWRVRRAE